MTTPKEALSHKLHHLWTWAVGKEGYDKSEWLALEKMISEATAPARRCVSCRGRGVVTDPDPATLKDGPAFDAADFIEKAGAVYHCFRCNGTGEEPADVPEPQELFGFAALVIGYNELASQSESMGDRLYWRLMRQKAMEAFIARGGEKFVRDGTSIMQLPSRPEIPLLDTDIEAMRAAVAAHDAAKGGT